MALTQRAQQAATEGLASADSLYLWQWQEGRINRQQGRSDKALAAYEQAVATLETISYRNSGSRPGCAVRLSRHR